MVTTRDYEIDGDLTDVFGQPEVANGRKAIPGTVEPAQPEETPEQALAALQAGVEGVPAAAKTIEFMGKRFRIAEKVGLMPLMRFAHAASQQDEAEAGDMDALASIYEMLRDCILGPNEIPAGTDGHDPGDWKKFERHAVDTKAGHDELLAVVGQVIEMMTARPTGEPSGSSPGPPVTSASSTGSRSGGRARASNSSRRGKRAT